MHDFCDGVVDEEGGECPAPSHQPEGEGLCGGEHLGSTRDQPAGRVRHKLFLEGQGERAVGGKEARPDGEQYLEDHKHVCASGLLEAGVLRFHKVRGFFAEASRASLV